MRERGGTGRRTRLRIWRPKGHGSSTLPVRTTLLAAFLVAQSAQIFAQAAPERFWVAGRYDGNRVIVYFDKVKFEGALARRGRKIAPPVADLFFDPVELPAEYIGQFQNKPGAEHFAIGDHYDLILGNGITATIKLTTLVGCEADEEVGNDSFIGALATIEPPNSLIFTQNYYAVRRHHESRASAAKVRPKTAAEYRKYAGFVDEPVRLDTETEMARLLDQAMKVSATDAEKALAAGVSPALKVQPFQIADGSLRYYVQAVWKSRKEKGLEYPYAVGAWIAPRPTLHVLVLEKRTNGYDDFGAPALLNVVDLGASRTGVILEIHRDASRELVLAEYRDGSAIKDMRVLQSIAAGE